MAISIVTSPQQYQPVYNPFYYTVTSTNVSQLQFQFVFDIYTPRSTYITRLLQPPRPNAQGVMDPHDVLRTYVSYDLGVQNNFGFTSSSNMAIQYVIQFGESYSQDVATGSTIYTGLTSSTGYTWNSFVQYKELATWNYLNYQLSSNTQFLTKMPAIALINPWEHQTLTYFSNLTGTTYQYAQVTVFQSSGGTRNYIIRNDVWSGSSPNSQFVHFGVGPWNLNGLNVTGSTVSGSTAYPMINSGTDYQYTVQYLNKQTTGYTSPLQTFVLNPKCYIYSPVRLQFLNSLGSWDYFTFPLVSRKSFNITRNTYEQVLPYNYTVGQRGVTVIDVDSQESMLVNSDYIDDTTSEWLSKELYNSNEVYELQMDGSAIPIIIQDANFEVQKYINNVAMNQYTVTYNYAFKYSTRIG